MDAFPAPGTPEGDRWAAAGYPVDQSTGQPAIPPEPAPAAVTPFPAPGTPEGDRWAAAGHPVDPATHMPVVPAPLSTADGNSGLPVAGDLLGYPCHDSYSSPARTRVQIIVVTGVEPTGHVRGMALGYADDAASFSLDQLIPLS